jgi:hypothetical protein
VWNAWRKERWRSKPDLRRADLRGVNLGRANLGLARLCEASLRSADLSASDLWRADLRGADLWGVTLMGARLDATELADTDLAYAIVGSTLFVDLDLRPVRGLELARHSSPSSIGIDTLYRSAGQIPEVFLRGCGVPDEMIKYIPSLVGAEQAIRFSSCFVSYSTKDDDFAKRLHARLRQEHARVWFAPEDVNGGEKLHLQIDCAIEYYDRLLLVLSQASLQSEWVMTEIRRARRQERRERRRKLFPIPLVPFDTLRDWECFDADSGKDLAVEVREYFIPDFSNWKEHDAFETAFAKLLRDLRAAERPT